MTSDPRYIRNIYRRQLTWWLVPIYVHLEYCTFKRKKDGSDLSISLRPLTTSWMLACMLFPGLLKTGRRAGRMRSRYSSCVHSFTRNSTGSRTAARTSCERTSCSRIGQMCWNHSFWRKKITQKTSKCHQSIRHVKSLGLFGKCGCKIAN